MQLDTRRHHVMLGPLMLAVSRADVVSSRAGFTSAIVGLRGWGILSLTWSWRRGERSVGLEWRR